MKVLALDPGKQKDSFGVVAAKRENGIIYVLNAQRFLGMKYLEVEEHITNLYKNHQYDYVVLELNNTGHHVIEVLERNGVPITPVTTIANIKDPKKKYDPQKMEKNEIVKQMMSLFQENKIVFPVRSNPELDELKRQLSIFSEIKTEAGNVSYRAEGQEHDDLVMALMLAIWKLRVYDVSLTVVNPYIDDDD